MVVVDPRVAARPAEGVLLGLGTVLDTVAGAFVQRSREVSSVVNADVGLLAALAVAVAGEPAGAGTEGVARVVAPLGDVPAACAARGGCPPRCRVLGKRPGSARRRSQTFSHCRRWRRSRRWRVRLVRQLI